MSKLKIWVVEKTVIKSQFFGHSQFLFQNQNYRDFNGNGVEKHRVTAHSRYIFPKFLRSIVISYLPCFQYVLSQCTCSLVKQPIILQTFFRLFHRLRGSVNIQSWVRQAPKGSMCNLNNKLFNVCHIQGGA